MCTIGIPALPEKRPHLGEELVELISRHPLEGEGANPGRIRDKGLRLARDPMQDRGRRGMAPFPRRRRDSPDCALPGRVQHIEQARFSNTRWPSDGRDFPAKCLTQLRDPLSRFRTEIEDRVYLLIAAEHASRER